MPLTSGSRLGVYEIVGLLGAGGMGEVYRARDTNLGRDVALKTLPDTVTHDRDRLLRFRREAQLLAALNHPHIAGIYGLDESGGQSVLVLELVEGETLADRLRQGPLPVEEALAIAGEIAEALEAAHERGIIHRDLKPANIALTAQDRVKVLDFGLAKAADPAATAGGGDPLHSPTVTSPAMLTGVGVILGTAAYMSPEQARGRAADKRSDVWAFGCVLYEMLTGQRAFKGEDVSDTLASVLRSDPDWSALPPSLPPAVRSLLAGCLERSHRDRIGDISAALFVLKRVPLVTADRPSRDAVGGLWPKALWALTGAAAGAAAAMLLWQRPLLPDRQVARFALEMPDAQLTLSRPSIAVSPDGRHIAYAADGQLYLHSVSNGVSRPIPGADPAIHPAFSPDGQSIVFWTEPALKRISVTGGVPVTLCPTAPAPFGVDWSEGWIVFVEPGTGIMRVSENGGTPETLVRQGGSEGLVQSPQLLPDGDTLLFTLAPRLVSATSSIWDTAQIVAQSLKTGERKTLVSGGSDARYLRTGHLIYMVEGTMMAVAFDLRSLTAASGATPVVEGVRRSAPLAGGGAHIGLSTTGLLAYLPGPARSGQDEMFLYNRKGEITPLKLPRGVYAYPRASLDGKWLAFESSDGKNATVSVYDLSGASSVRRLTFGGNNRSPIWSRDGTRVAFQSDREGDLGIFWQPLHGGTAERLTRAEPGTAHVPESWSPRSDVFLYAVTGESETSLWLYSIADRKSTRFGGVTSAFLTDAVFSPDGRWIAYQAADAGMGEATTYVQPYPSTGAKYEIARGGRPMWSHDGKELFFVPGPGQFRSVSVRTEPAFGFTAPAVVPRRFGLAPPASPRPYDILPNGQFVALDAIAQGEKFSSQIHVVLNWFEELKAKAPTPK